MIGINISDIRNTIVKGIKEYTGFITVDTDNPHNKPKYPYYSYKMTSLYVPDQFTGTLGQINKIDTIEQSLVLQPKMTISFNSYSDDVVEANQAALKAWEWFKFVGYLKLKDKNIIVVDVMSIQDRTVMLVDDYEHRQGFDVVFRTTHTIEREIETIEKFEFKESE